jgi:hypothetical protein
MVIKELIFVEKQLFCGSNQHQILLNTQAKSKTRYFIPLITIEEAKVWNFFRLLTS